MKSKCPNNWPVHKISHSETLYSLKIYWAVINWSTTPHMVTLWKHINSWKRESRNKWEGLSTTQRNYQNNNKELQVHKSLVNKLWILSTLKISKKSILLMKCYLISHIGIRINRNEWSKESYLLETFIWWWFVIKFIIVYFLFSAQRK